MLPLLCAVSLLIVVSGCAPSAPAPQAGESVTLLHPDEIATLTAPPTRAPKAGAAEPTAQSRAPEPSFAQFDPASFSDPTTIDNPWMPMAPGARWVYEGTALDDEGQQIARRIEFTVTDLTKEIAGVRTVVAWILDYNDGDLVEKEIAFYAQDDMGAVWYLGEYPEAYEGGEFVEAPTWIAGMAGAKPGIKLTADPKPGVPPVYQGWGPEVEWSDYGQVQQTGQETCVPAGCYKDVLVNAESSLGEANAFQLKYYASGVGEVRVGWKGEDASHEELQLVELVQLSPEALAEIRALALEVEKHAYEISPDLYGKTKPME
jgi:hypothetical protein